MRKICSLFLLLGFCFFSYAQDFQTLWSEYDADVENRLPKSADAVLDKIEEKAIAELNEPHLLKMIFQRCALLEMNNENPQDTIVKYCESYLDKLSEPSRVFLALELYEYKNDISDFLINFNIDYAKAVSMMSYAEIFDADMEFDIEKEPTLFDYSLHKLINYYDCRASYQTEIDDLYSKLIDFDRENGFVKAYLYNKIDLIKRSPFVSRFEKYQDLLSECSDNEIVAEIKLLQIDCLTSYLVDKKDYVYALRLCDEAMSLVDKKHPVYQQCTLFRNAVTKKYVDVRLQKVNLPGEPIPVGLTYRNTTNPSYRIVKTNSSILHNPNANFSDKSFHGLLLNNIVCEETVEIPQETDYQYHSSLIALPPLERGFYFLVFSNDDSFDELDNLLFVPFQVSALSFVSLGSEDESTVVVIDRASGSPKCSVKAEFLSKKYSYNSSKYVLKRLGVSESDSDGVIETSDFKNFDCMMLSYLGDSLLSEYRSHSYRYNDVNERLKTKFFTDRPIYRPGQTVNFKGIILKESSDKKELCENLLTTVYLRDANYQIIDSLSLTTNEYGSFSGSFVLPADRMSGDYCIHSTSGSLIFKVEKYKRPTFEVRFDSPQHEYSMGDSIRVSGKIMAYSGFGLDNVKYRYTVVRKQCFPLKYHYGMPFNMKEDVVCSGESNTLCDGAFYFDFQLTPLLEDDKNNELGYVFTVKVEATNAQGETQTGSFSLSASLRKYFISLDGDLHYSDKGVVVEQKQLKNVKIKVQNASGESVSSPLMCKIIKKNEPITSFLDLGDFDRQLICDSLLDAYFPHYRFYKKESIEQDVVCQYVINVDSETPLLNAMKVALEPGRYEIELSALDDNLSSVTENILVFNKKSKKLPVNSLLWTYVDKTTAQPGDMLNISVGSSENDVTALLFVFNNGKMIKSEYITLNNNVLHRSYKVKEENRGVISIQLAAVKNNMAEICNETVTIPYDNLKLDISVETESDVLWPDEEVSLKIKIRDHKGNPIDAELLACMYDASLDKFASNLWNFNTLPFTKIPVSLRADNGFSTISKCQTVSNGYVFLPQYPLLSDVSLLSKPLYRGVGLYNKFSVMETMAAAVEEDYEGLSNDSSDFASETVLDKNALLNNDNGDAKVRSDFSETAFFFPHLKTDKKGNVIIDFITPSTLTEWNLRLLAYNKTLSVGKLEKELFTQKPLMVMADVPRFLYADDTLFVAANIINNSDAALSPGVRFVLFDGISDSVYYIEPTDIAVGEINAGGSRPVAFKVVAPDNASLLTFRFSVSAGRFFDSEQYTVPVLKKDVLVTNTMSLTVNPNSARTFGYSSKGNETPVSYTLNFSANPVWYAIMAMPYIIEGNELYIENIFHKYFTNALASYLVSDIPELENYYEEWENHDADALLSQLEKDENLRNVLLKSTPWMLEAFDEKRQRENIRRLFDAAEVREGISNALVLIAEKQKNSGGWPWIEGMPESEMMTQYILEGFGRLKSLGIENDSLPMDVIANACRFVENKIVERYKKITEEKYSNNWICSDLLIDDMLALSYFIDFESDSEYVEASGFFLNKMSEDWKQHGFAEQASIALILNRNGRRSESLAILNSLREFAQTNELGMYWLSSQSPVNKSFRRGVSVSEEVKILEAFREIDYRPGEVDAMRLWLLTQKQTNKWDNNRQTAEAVFSIISGNEKWLSDDNVSIEINGEAVGFEGSEPGTRHIKRTFASGEISENGEISIDNKTSHIVWGGFFTQYSVPIDELRASDNDLSITRELYVERTAQGKIEYVPVSQSDIRVGDKIKTVITIESRQDLEFVYLKDLYGACFEPIEQVSAYAFSDGLFYYRSIDDIATECFFENIPRGKYEVSHESFVTKEGCFSGGYALIQCQYAPEFGAYSDAERVKVVGKE
ncbi:MAG: MG2 domain-containing protein [Candidatus Limimorpha sp.]